MEQDLVKIAEMCILNRCYQEVQTRRNYLKGRYETVIGCVQGLWRLRKDALKMMKAMGNPIALEYQPATYDLYIDAFQKALKKLLKEGLLREGREKPVFNRTYRRKFAITPQGLDYFNSIQRKGEEL